MSRFVLMSLMLLLSRLEVTGASMERYNHPGATAPGDIIIGGLFTIHEAVEKYTDLSQPRNCSRFFTEGLAEAFAMIHAVEIANKSPMLKGLNITLGYRIYDTCFDVTTALWAVHDITHTFLDCDSAPNSSQHVNPTMAVIGALSSEISIAIARELSLLLIPQISFASTAVILSDKSRFPAFMRTVPNDSHQTLAMVKLLKDYKWNWVGVIITDGDYGRYAMESFVTQATEKGICVAFKEILPESLTDEKLNTSINKAVDTILRNFKVKVVVSFARPPHMKMLFESLQGNVSGNRVWVASDNWSAATEILENVNLSDIGHVVGFTFKAEDVPSFNEYLENLQIGNEVAKNVFLREFVKQYDSSNITKEELIKKDLIKNTDIISVFRIQMAVSAIATAVAELCKSTGKCKTPSDIQPSKLLKQLMNVTFEKEGVWCNFDKNGDVNLGYDVSLWIKKESEESYSLNTTTKIAEYDPLNESLIFVFKTNDVLHFQAVESKCSNSCQPGQFKKSAEGQHTCCYDCINCTENHYSNNTDMLRCEQCEVEIEWSGAGSSKCYPKTHEYFEWNSGFAIALLTIATLGSFLLFMVSALFIWYRHSPVVKAAGGPLCQLILFSLLGSFVSILFFVGKPSNITCMVRQVIFGLSFTLCVSCILVKSLKVLLVFHMSLELKDLLCKLYKPYIIICVCTGLQVIICTTWLLLCGPYQGKVVNSQTILIECNECSYVAFGVMLGYTALLALVCFTCAYKGRKLPEKYNEAKFITFGMLIYLMAWVIFIPVHLTTSGKYVPAVEVVVILISNYGILSCHFLPKCYIIIFKKEQNTKDAFIKNVYEYAKRSSENIRGLSRTEPERTESSVYTISTPSLLPPEETLKTEAQTQ